MKKVLLICFSLIILCTQNGFAQMDSENLTVDVSGLYGTVPSGVDFLDSTFGFRIGGSYDYMEIWEGELQLRADLSYFKWDGDVLGLKTEYRRIPIFIGGRYNKSFDNFSLYGEVGVELSMDKVEVSLGALSISVSETHFGLTPGVGFEYPITDVVIVDLGFRYHIIADKYSTLGLSVGYRF